MNMERIPENIVTFQQYVRCVGVALGFNSPQYLEFTQFIRDYSTGTGYFHSYPKVLSLFGEHLELIPQFMRFFPKKKTFLEELESLDAGELYLMRVRLVSKIKNQYTVDGRYRAFLNILMLYDSYMKTTRQTALEVEELFPDRPDLVVQCRAVLTGHIDFSA